MIISYSRRFIFFHVPKSGGTSLTKLLDQGLSWNDIIIGGTKTGEVFNGEWARRFRLFKHTTPNTLHRIIGDDEFISFHKFLFVRDPIERFKSAVQFLFQVVREERDWAIRAYTEEQLNEIRDLKSVQCAINSKFFRLICDKNPGSCNESELCFKPQSYYYSYLCTSYPETSEYYKIEELEDSINRLVSLGLVTKLEVEKSHVLKSRSNVSKKILESDLDEKSISDLKEIFAEDYRLFQY